VGAQDGVRVCLGQWSSAGLSGGECLGCHGVGRLGMFVALDDGDAGSSQGVEAEVAAASDPVVVLFGEDGTDEVDKGVAVGKMPTTSVRRRISRGLLAQIWR